MAMRLTERTKCAVRSPAFRPQAFGVTEWICIRPFRLKLVITQTFARNGSSHFQPAEQATE